MVSFDPRISSLSMYQWHWISAPEGVCGSCNGSSVLCFHFGGEFLTDQCRSAWPLLNSVASLGWISAQWLRWLGDGCSGLGHSGPSLVGCEKGVRGGGAGVRVNALYNGCVVIMPIFSVA